jgi:Family of unknown function (DUF6023)
VPNLVLLAAVVLVVSLGVWWWVSSAPPDAPRAGGSVSGDGRTTGVSADEVARLLPEDPDAIRRDAQTLAGGEGIDWQATLSGRRFRVEILCLGDGIVEVLVGSFDTGADQGETVPCTGEVERRDINPVTEDFRVTVRRSTPEEAVVAAQLVVQ